MKCDIIKDLLPSYIEGLTSETSSEEINKHLAKCEACQAFYQEMMGEIKEELPITEIKQFDYLKKVRKIYFRKSAIAVGSTAVILMILAKLFVIGFPVPSQDMDMKYQMKDNHLEIIFELKNGHDLIWPKVRPEFIYDDNRKIIGFEQYCKPTWVFNNPFDDVGSSFSLGTQLPDPGERDEFTNTVIIEFADKTVKFVNGELVEKQIK